MNADERSSASAPSPIPNSYWVLPGRLLAGEYPGGMSRREALERLQRLVGAGVSSFIDLTDQDELPPYERLLAEVTERPLRYRRFPITDHGVPEPPATMSRILDYLDAELSAGECVYVHCRAGIGRTGTTIACHLIRTGLANRAAFEHLQVLWKQCGRSRSWPRVPETDEQVAFVMQWREQGDAGPSAQSSDAGRYEGALIGLALGEAFGLRSLAHGLNPAALTGGVALLSTGAETATTQIVAESLLAQDACDPRDQLQRYAEWLRTTRANVPSELKRAVAAWQWSKKPHAGSHDPQNLDPHTLARSLAVALYARGDPSVTVEFAAEVSRTTLQSPIVLDLCRVWAALFADALAGVSKVQLLAFDGPVTRRVRERSLKGPVKALLLGRAPTPQPSAVDALSVTHHALSCCATGATRDALLRAAAQGPSAAALCGALLGALEGIEAFPTQWRQQLAEEPQLRALARRLLA